jgi:Fe-S-cluster formation regulator IscX/YfhJ
MSKHPSAARDDDPVVLALAAYQRREGPPDLDAQATIDRVVDAWVEQHPGRDPRKRIAAQVAREQPAYDEEAARTYERLLRLFDLGAPQEVVQRAGERAVEAYDAADPERRLYAALDRWVCHLYEHYADRLAERFAKAKEAAERGE